MGMSPTCGVAAHRCGVAAHRGGAAAAPENTLAAFRRALADGAAMLECDLRRTRDGAIVAVHDATVDRTTDGHGRVADLPLATLRRLDAGGWKEPAFADERIPTLDEVLELDAPHVLWNLQIKRGEPIAGAVAQRLVERGLLERAFLACGNAAGREARAVHPRIQLCNLARQQTREAYLEHALAEGSAFLQLHHLRGMPDPAFVARARAAGLRVIHFCDPAAPRVDAAVASGVDFVLVDDVPAAVQCVDRTQRRTEG